MTTGSTEEYQALPYLNHAHKLPKSIVYWLSIVYVDCPLSIVFCFLYIVYVCCLLLLSTVYVSSLLPIVYS